MDDIKTFVRFEAGSTTCCGFLFGCYEVLRKRKNNKVTCVNKEQDKTGNVKECQEQIKELIQETSTKLEEPSKVEDLFTVCPKQHGGNIVGRGDLQSASYGSPECEQAIDELSVKKKKKTVTFSEYAELEFADYYERTCDRTWLGLSHEDMLEIRRDLNEYKFFEMEVHPDSWKYTRFHNV